MTAGKGIAAEVDGRQLILGNEKFITENQIHIDSNVKERIHALSAQGKALILVSEMGKIIGIIALSDTLRPEAKDIVAKLKSMGTETVLLTGDNRKTADYFASQAGIGEVHADLLPKEKVEKIIELKERAKLCMVGDGVNDAPALKTADVGIAMGALGSDIAVDAADVALMTDDITKLPYLKWLSNKTVRTIKTAITLSMCINLVAVILSITGILTPTTGALVHNAGSCFVVLLAALLYDAKPPAN